MKKVLCILLALLLVLISSGSIAEVGVWSTMKNFKVKTNDGTTFDLYKVLEEKELVLIDLWYIDCYFCPSASASLDVIYDEYKDRVAFLSVNPYDNANSIKMFMEARGFTIPYANYRGGANWTQWYPWFILIDNEATVVFSGNGFDNPYDLATLLDETLALTPEEKEHYIDINLQKTIAPDGREKEKATDPVVKKQWNAIINSARFAYNLKNDMSLEIAGESVSKLVIDTNLEILQQVDITGDFYIIPEGTPFTVTMKPGKGFKPGKAYMTAREYVSAGAEAFNNFYTDVCEDIPFKKAKKEKNNYIFEFDGKDYSVIYYFVESGELDLVIKDSVVGLHTFTSEEEAAKYFDDFAEKCGYEIKWHIENDQGEVKE